MTAFFCLLTLFVLLVLPVASQNEPCSAITARGLHAFSHFATGGNTCSYSGTATDPTFFHNPGSYSNYCTSAAFTSQCPSNAAQNTKVTGTITVAQYAGYVRSGTRTCEAANFTGIRCVWKKMATRWEVLTMYPVNQV